MPKPQKLRGEGLKSPIFRAKALEVISPIPPLGEGSLMNRVVSILDPVRANVVRVVNSNMVIAYWCAPEIHHEPGNELATIDDALVLRIR